MNPSSTLLQDLLHERKASQRASRISETDNATHERQTQSSPIGPSAANKPRPRRSSGLTVPKNMGLREMEEYISKLDKQNFDLKLEIFQRRQRSDALELKAAKVDEVEIQNDELRQLNDDLLQELEKRDQAVGEAVSLICELEAKVARLENERQHNIRPFTPIENCYATPEVRKYHQLLSSTSAAHSPSSVKPSGANVAGRQGCVTLPDRDRQHDEDRLLRSPSFLSDDEPNTSALRSLISSDNKGSTANGFGLPNPSMLSLRRVGSPFSQDDLPEVLDEDAFPLNPTRLSLLSESSFVSVYGQKKEKTTPYCVTKQTLNASPPENGDISAKHLSPHQEGRVRQWIEHRDHPATPSRQSTSHARLSSIGEILKSDQPSLRELPHPASPTRSSGRLQRQQTQRPEKADKKASFAGPIFGPDALPPTPGTMSSATLGGRSSNHSITAERSLNDGTSRPTTDPTSDIPHRSSHGSRNGLRSTQDNHAETGLRSAFDNDTDFDVSDEDKHPAYRDTSSPSSHYLSDNSRATPLMGESSKASQILGANAAQRPRLNNHITEPMSNGDNMGTSRPSRTISYPSPGRTHQNMDRNMSGSPKHPMAGSNGSRESSTQQESTSKPSLSRSLSSYSKLPSTAPAPSQTFTSRLFRRNPSGTPPAPAPTTTTSPESKIRPPRRPSLYSRTISNPPPSLTAPVKNIPGTSRPVISGTPEMNGLNPKRFSGAFASKIVRKGDVVAGDFGADHEEQQRAPQQQPQSKRLSVGAIGRSASLRIKEGFGRKK
ncbi:MAG: hypothetical protein Q9226_003128 [Calogaya cf. arnoldii]